MADLNALIATGLNGASPAGTFMAARDAAQQRTQRNALMSQEMDMKRQEFAAGRQDAAQKQAMERAAILGTAAMHAMQNDPNGPVDPARFAEAVQGLARAGVLPPEKAQEYLTLDPAAMTQLARGALAASVKAMDVGNLQVAQQNADTGRLNALTSLEKLRQGDPTTAERNAAALGLKPGTQEHGDYIRQATTKPLVAMGTEETSFAKEYGKTQGQRLSSMIEAGDKASQRLAMLEMLGQNIAQFDSGFAGNFRLDAGRLSQFMGVDPTTLGLPEAGTLSAGEVARALSNGLALQFRDPSSGAGMPGAMSDADRQFLLDIVPNLGKSPKANSILLEVYKRQAQRTMQTARAAESYAQQNGSLGGFDAGLAGQNLFDDLRDDADEIMGEVGAPGRGGSVVRNGVQYDETVTKDGVLYGVKDGEWFILGGGK